jgi:rubrerythrin
MAADTRSACSIAIEIEQNGERLYRGLSEAFVLDPLVSELFSRLAGEENTHSEQFRILLEEVSGCAPADGGYSILNAYARVFSRSRLSDEIGSVGRSLQSALDFAIRREMDSIFFYHEAADGRHDALGEAFGKVIAEERKHFRELTELRNRLAES